MKPDIHHLKAYDCDTILSIINLSLIHSYLSLLQNPPNKIKCIVVLVGLAKKFKINKSVNK